MTPHQIRCQLAGRVTLYQTHPQTNTLGGRVTLYQTHPQTNTLGGRVTLYQTHPHPALRDDDPYHTPLGNSGSG